MLGNNYNDGYGYTINHQTANLWMRMEEIHDYDVRNKDIYRPVRNC